MSEGPTVWILGAGFSRSLGGPLLKDLLSMGSRSRLCAQEAIESNHPTFNQVYSLYHYGSGFPEGYLFDPAFPPLRGERLWEHAEEFLELVSDAVDADGALSSSHASQLEAQWKLLRAQMDATDKSYGTPYHRFAGLQGELDIPALKKATLQLIAAECSFVRRNASSNLDHWERARPYRAWGECLDEHHTLITFNYDTVVEEVAVPHVLVQGVKCDAELVREGAPTLLKLHGSVDWEERDRVYHRVSKSCPAHPAIATPGNAKLESREGGFKPLWDLAGERLRAAKKIAILGYSMPASDSSAVELVLNSIAENSQEGLKIDIVLGRPSFDSERIKNLLDVAMSQRPSLPRSELLAEFREKLRFLESKREELLRGKRILQGIHQMLDGTEKNRLEFQYNSELNARNFGLYLGQETDRHPKGETEVRPLLAQDYLRMFATSESQRERNGLVEVEIRQAQEALKEFKRSVDESK